MNDYRDDKDGCKDESMSASVDATLYTANVETSGRQGNAPRTDHVQKVARSASGRTRESP